MAKEKKTKIDEKHYIEAILSKTKLKEIMSQPPVSINISDKFSEVPKKFNEHGIRHLPVVNDDNRLVGLMSQRDLYKVESPRKLEDGSWYYDKETLDNVILQNVMIKNPVCLHPDDTLGDAIVKMVDHRYGCIPIVDRFNVLCGVITQIDILRLTAEIMRD